MRDHFRDVFFPRRPALQPVPKLVQRKRPAGQRPGGVVHEAFAVEQFGRAAGHCQLFFSSGSIIGSAICPSAIRRRRTHSGNTGGFSNQVSIQRIISPFSADFSIEELARTTESSCNKAASAGHSRVSDSLEGRVGPVLASFRAALFNVQRACSFALITSFRTRERVAASPCSYSTRSRSKLDSSASNDSCRTPSTSGARGTPDSLAQSRKSRRR